MSSYEDHHRIAIARELTYAAGCPLRDRYGFAARDEDVLKVVEIVAANPDDQAAVNAIGVLNAVGDAEIAEEGLPTTEEYDQRIVAALRPLIEQRRDAAVRGLG